MIRIYYLSSCSTCKRIINELNLPDDAFFQCIKNNPISKEDLEKMHAFSKSYESLFSKRAIKYKTMGLKEKKLSETDFKNLILSEYTFLKRPVFLIENDIFVGNSKKTIELLKNKYNF